MTEQTELAPVSLATLIAQKKEEPPLVQIKRGHVVLDAESALPYEIELSRINTPAKLLEWVRHLSEKTWITAWHIHELVVTVAKACPHVNFAYGC